ncbi:MAG TPA: DUF5715 family protein [Terriglobales bacterium]|nr:DUF5715 family protein [Terriglobales bacterium]
MGSRSLRLFLILSVLSSSHLFGASARPRASVRVRRTRTHHIFWNPVFRGSRQSLIKQNEEIDRLQLPRIEDEAQLDDLILRQELVPLPAGETLTVAGNLPENRRYCRPWTADFLRDLSAAYYQQFHAPLQVNSAVRTVEVQHKLRRHNRNAAPESGETASSHLAGLTIDISKRGMSKQQRRWMDDYMLPLKQMGLIEPEEERRQPVFHVMVSQRYAEWKQLLPSPDTSLAAVPAGK